MTYKPQHSWQASFLDNFGRLGVTMLIVFVLLVLSAFPFKIGGFGEIRPSFLLMAVYYWAIFRPQMLSVSGTFTAGLLLDLLADFPLGLNALTLILVRYLTSSQRKFMLGQKFPVIWAGMQLVSFGAGMFQWMVFSLFEWHFMSVKPVFTSTLMTGLFFPMIVLPLYGVNRAVDRKY